jgi:hypothetical protein
MPSDETRCAWKSRYTGAVCNEPEQTRHHWHESLRQFCDMQCDNDNLDCHPFAPSAPPAEVECDTDYGIEGVGLPPLQCDCHKDGDPRHCSKCIKHSWGKAGARPTEQREEHGFGCDPAKCIGDALKAFQGALINHCDEPHEAEVFAIRAHAAAMKSLKRIGRQPARFGGD